MSKTLHLNIASPEKQLFDGEISRITLPGSAGSFTILPRHAPIVSSLNKGTVSYVADGTEHTVEVKGGFVEMNGEVVSVCIS